MNEITLPIGRRSYALACAPGEEEHIRSLGQEVDRRIQRLGANLSQNDAKNILIAALMLADELHEERQKAKAQPSAADTSSDAAKAQVAELEERLADAEEEAERLRQHLANANGRLKELGASKPRPIAAEDSFTGQLAIVAETLERSAALLERGRAAH